MTIKILLHQAIQNLEAVHFFSDLEMDTFVVTIIDNDKHFLHYYYFLFR